MDSLTNLLLAVVLGAPGFILGIVVHESTHALVALRLGDPTARNSGRISLDPRRHIDPMGIIVYVVTSLFSGGRFAFGWAKPVPINPYNFRDRRRDFMLCSIAAPFSNLVQAFLWTLLLKVYVQAVTPAWFAMAALPPVSDPLGYVMFSGVLINVVLAVFNFIPIPPLDGSRLLAWMLPEQYAYHLDRLEPYGMAIIFALMYFRILSVVFQSVGAPVLLFFLRIVGF